MSTAKAATSEGGTTFDTFKHRTGKYRVHHDDQREGWNYAQVIHDDITTADGEFDIFMNVSKADVQRVAETYLRDDNRLVLTILPRSTGAVSR